MRKSTTLKVTGILLIIFSSVRMLFDIAGLVGTTYILSSPETAQIAGVNTVLTTISVAAAAIIDVYQLAIGILGILSCDKPRRGNLCFTLGILAIVLIIVRTFLGGIPRGAVSTVMVLLGMISGLVLPILYSVGAYQLKKIQPITPQYDEFGAR